MDGWILKGGMDVNHLPKGNDEGRGTDALGEGRFGADDCDLGGSRI